MQDDELFKLMKNECPHLPDEGFSDRVLEGLPLRRKWRVQILGGAIALASLLAFAVWVLISDVSSFSLLPMSWAMSAAAVAFWSFVALFAFVSIDEGVFEL